MVEVERGRVVGATVWASLSGQLTGARVQVLPLCSRPRLISRLRLMTAARVENAILLRSTPRCRQRRWPLVTSHAIVRSTIGRCCR